MAPGAKKRTIIKTALCSSTALGTKRRFMVKAAPCSGMASGSKMCFKIKAAAFFSNECFKLHDLHETLLTCSDNAQPHDSISLTEEDIRVLSLLNVWSHLIQKAGRNLFYDTKYGTSCLDQLLIRYICNWYHCTMHRVE